MTNVLLAGILAVNTLTLGLCGGLLRWAVKEQASAFRFRDDARELLTDQIKAELAAELLEGARNRVHARVAGGVNGDHRGRQSERAGKADESEDLAHALRVTARSDGEVRA